MTLNDKNSELKIKKTGQLTIPTDVDVIDETLALLKRWGADAIRDCDGTEMPEAITSCGTKIYATYYTTRKDNIWAKANPDEIQQMYICTPFYTASSNILSIPLMKGLHTELLEVNDKDDIKRWWEVMDRSTGTVFSSDSWSWDPSSGSVILQDCEPFHDYSVSFLAYIIWDPVHMYNAVVNNWKNFEHQMTFDVRQPKTRAYSMERLRKFIEEHAYVDVIRFTTFFHQFTLVFDDLAREKYVDWYGYSASVSPYILEKFEKEVAYKFRPEFIIDEGYHNNPTRIPSKEFRDFMHFQMREVSELAKEMVDICHEYGKEAMMFLGDHWIGTEPLGPYFKNIGLDAVVGSVGNGATLRLISDIEGARYTEGRLLPYFFPDTFHEGGNPLAEARYNWVTARRALLRKPLDRIGYGGYIKLALQFPDFIEYIDTVTSEFRELYASAKDCTPYTMAKVAVLNCWGKLRAWGNHMVHHAIYHKQNYSYAGVIETLSGAPLDVSFISFENILDNPQILEQYDAILNIGDANTAWTGGAYWSNEKITTAIKSYIWNGGAFIGIGEPSGYQFQGRSFQLASILGVENESDFTLNRDKYNWTEQEHFITDGFVGNIDFGEPKPNVYALEDTIVLKQSNKAVQLATNHFGQGRSVYISGLPYSFENARLLLRSILWATHKDLQRPDWYSDNPLIDIHAYPENKRYCVVNNTWETQTGAIHLQNDKSINVSLEPNEIRWFTL